MGAIDIEGSVVATEPFRCIQCGERFEPPSRYFWLIIPDPRDGKDITGPVCLICARYS